METGICRRCACNWVTPCIDEKYGPCWWIDKDRLKLIMRRILLVLNMQKRPSCYQKNC